MKCEYEGMNGECRGEVTKCYAMTAYVFDGVHNSPEDPNKDFYACDYHYEEYRSFWQEQWDEYYGIVREGIYGAQVRQELQNRQAIEEDRYRKTQQELFEDFASSIRFK